MPVPCQRHLIGPTFQMHQLRMAHKRRLGLGVLVGAIMMSSTAGADPLTSWTPGPDAAPPNTYDGYIDVPAMNATVPTGLFTVSGWFVDRSAQGWSGADEIEIWQGTMNGGGTLLTSAGIDRTRPDVAAAEGNPFWVGSGFGGLVPADSLSPGPETLSVYAHTPGKGWWYKQVNVTVSPDFLPAPVSSSSTSSLPIVAIEKPKDGELVLTTRDYVIVGYALDRHAGPNQGVAGSGVDRVEVYIGGERDNGGTFVGDADLGYSDPVPASLYGSRFASAGWRLTFTPTHFDNNTYLLFAYARSTISGQEDVVSRFFAIRDSP